MSCGVGLSLRSDRTVLENTIVMITAVSTIVSTSYLLSTGVPYTSEVVQYL